MADIIHGISINDDGKLDVQLSGDDFVRNEDGTIGVATGAGTGETLTAGGGIDITDGEVSVKLGGVVRYSAEGQQEYVNSSVFYNQASAGLTLRVSSRLSTVVVGDDMCLTVKPEAFVKQYGPLQVNTADGLHLKYGSGLTYDSTKGLIIDDNTVTTLAAAEVAKVVASAPEDLDTLKEIADYIASDKTNAANINNTLSEHTTSIAALETGKQDKLSVGNGISLSGASIDLYLSEYHKTPEKEQESGSPLYLSPGGLALKVGSGLTVNSGGFLNVKAGAGLTLEDDELNIKVGSGLTVDSTVGLIIPRIRVKLTGDEFEGVDSNAIKAPLFYEGNMLKFSIGTGLRLDSFGTLFIDYEDLASRLAPLIAQTTQTTQTT